VAQWSERSPFTSKAAGSIFSENDPQCHSTSTRVKIANAQPKVAGFLLPQGSLVGDKHG
jgi:hypothetical protein